MAWTQKREKKPKSWSLHSWPVIPVSRSGYHLHEKEDLKVKHKQRKWDTKKRIPFSWDNVFQVRHPHVWITIGLVSFTDKSKHAGFREMLNTTIQLPLIGNVHLKGSSVSPLAMTKHWKSICSLLKYSPSVSITQQPTVVPPLSPIPPLSPSTSPLYVVDSGIPSSPPFPVLYVISDWVHPFIIF